MRASSTSSLLCVHAGGAIYLWYLSKELALTCGSVTMLLWAVALRYGAFTRKAQRAYQDGLAETNQVRYTPNLEHAFGGSLAGISTTCQSC